MELQTNVMSYGGDGVVRSIPAKPVKEEKLKEEHAGCACKGKTAAHNGKATNGEPDFTSYITGILAQKPDVVYSILWGGDIVAFLKTLTDGFAP